MGCHQLGGVIIGTYAGNEVPGMDINMVKECLFLVQGRVNSLREIFGTVSVSAISSTSRIKALDLRLHGNHGEVHLMQLLEDASHAFVLWSQEVKDSIVWWMDAAGLKVGIPLLSQLILFTDALMVGWGTLILELISR